MKVLIACEFSGIVRDAFRRCGHDAWSCDLLPTEGDPQWHVQAHIETFLEFWDCSHWDLLIAHPPCTFLANSSAKHLYIDGLKSNGREEKRWAAMADAAVFFKFLLDLPIPRIAIENPVMLGHAKKLIGVGQSQIIQPWQFGHGETKATCLWLKNLPKLTPTNIVEGREAKVHRERPGPDRWKNRSRTYWGIAEAMAEQFGTWVEDRDAYNRRFGGNNEQR